jgi:hypothetical protein
MIDELIAAINAELLKPEPPRFHSRRITGDEIKF